VNARRRTLLGIAALAVLFAAAPAFALDPHRAISQYVLSKWGPRDLASNAVHALLQTPDGYVWLGTNAGLVRFDGARFIVFSARTHTGFGDGGVTSLTLAPDGSLYLGRTSGGITRYKDRVFEALYEDLGPGTVSSIHADEAGGLWVGQQGRPLRRIADGERQSLGDHVGGLGPAIIAPDRTGGLWFGTWLHGLVHLADGTYRRHPGVSDAVQAIHCDRAGDVWVGTPHGLLRLHGDSVARFTAKDGLQNENVSAILQDRDGTLWVGTKGGGLFRRSGDRFTRLASPDGLSDDDVRCLLEDAEGNVWIGTADGLTRLGDGPFVTYGRPEGLLDPVVTTVAPSTDGAVWAGTSSGLVARLAAGAWTHFRPPGGVGREAVIALRETRDGLWVSADNGRLFLLRAGRFEEHTPQGVPQNWKVSAIFEDEQGTLFFVNGGGLARFDGRALVLLHPNPPSRGGYVHQIHQDRHGGLWLCSSIGLVRVEGSEYKVLAAGGPAPLRVRSIAEDADGSFWLATSAGLGNYRDGTLGLVSVAQGLPENYLRLVLDAGPSLLVASMGHVFRIEKRAALDVLAGHAARVSPAAFDTSDGLRATDAMLSGNPGFKDDAGRFWLATSRGVSSLDPSLLQGQTAAPAVRLETMSVDGRVEPLGRPQAGLPPEYPPGKGTVTLEYTAFAYRDAAHTRFRYRLDGLDDEWTDAGARRSAYYNNLPPGHYRFRAAASNRDGAWNGPEARLEFVIRPPFYRTAWFYAACLAAFLGLVGAAYTVRLAQMQARFAAVVEERTRIARELHDSLAQMLAAIGFQIDTAIKRLPEGEEQGPLRRNMDLAHSMARAGLAEVRRSIWVLRAQASGHDDDLASSLSSSLSQLTGDSGIGSTFTVTGEPRALPAEVQRNLLRIAHEAVSNAVRHAQAKSIGIRLQFETDAVCLRVNDDGRGFERSKVKGEHFGLVGIAERARSIGGSAQVESRPGAGTEIACRVPYGSAMS
jgi:signal transduction histidine kinase/ligand-binding sensor domain-containing protein